VGAFFPTAMTFAQGELWAVITGVVYSAPAGDIAGGLTTQGFTQFPTFEGNLNFGINALLPSTEICVPSATTACLYNRFRVEVSYDATPGNGSGPANVVLESPQSVKFTFFDPANIEMILKILNACTPPFNQWWVFAGGLTNVGVTIKVTDTATGAVKNYSSKKGQLFQPFADTAAFNCP